MRLKKKGLNNSTIADSEIGNFNDRGEQDLDSNSQTITKSQNKSSENTSLASYNWANSAQIHGNSRFPQESLNQRGLRLKQLMAQNSQLPIFFKEAIPKNIEVLQSQIQVLEESIQKSEFKSRNEKRREVIQRLTVQIQQYKTLLDDFQSLQGEIEMQDAQIEDIFRHMPAESKQSSGTINSSASIIQPHTNSQSIAEMSDQSFVMSLTSEGQTVNRQGTLSSVEQASFFLSRTTLGGSQTPAIDRKDTIKYKTMG